MKTLFILFLLVISAFASAQCEFKEGIAWTKVIDRGVETYIFVDVYCHFKSNDTVKKRLDWQITERIKRDSLIAVGDVFYEIADCSHHNEECASEIRFTGSVTVEILKANGRRSTVELSNCCNGYSRIDTKHYLLDVLYEEFSLKDKGGDRFASFPIFAIVQCEE